MYAPRQDRTGNVEMYSSTRSNEHAFSINMLTVATGFLEGAVFGALQNEIGMEGGVK